MNAILSIVLVLLFPLFAREVLHARKKSSSPVFALKLSGRVVGATTASLYRVQAEFKGALLKVYSRKEVTNIAAVLGALAFGPQSFLGSKISVAQAKPNELDRIHAIASKLTQSDLPPVGEFEGHDGVVLEKVVFSGDSSINEISCKRLPMLVLRYRDWLIDQGPNDPGKRPKALSKVERNEIIRSGENVIKFEAVIVDPNGRVALRVTENNTRGKRQVLVPLFRGPLRVPQGDHGNTQDVLDAIVYQIKSLKKDPASNDVVEMLFSNDREPLIQVFSLNYAEKNHSVCLHVVIMASSDDINRLKRKKGIHVPGSEPLPKGSRQPVSSFSAKVLVAAAQLLTRATKH